MDEPNVRVLVTICSYCRSVAWPPAASKTERTWISAEEYRRLGGRSSRTVSHGICPDCYEKAVAADEKRADRDQRG